MWLHPSQNVQKKVKNQDKMEHVLTQAVNKQRDVIKISNNPKILPSQYGRVQHLETEHESF